MSSSHVAARIQLCACIGRKLRVAINLCQPFRTFATTPALCWGMPNHVVIDRPQKRAQTARPGRPVPVSRSVARAQPLVLFRPPAPSYLPSSSEAEFQTDPYVDYGRFLTPEGGVLLIYKDLDLRLRHTLWRLSAWTGFTWIEGWLLLYHSPLHTDWINLGLVLAVAIVNWLIVAKPVEIYRRIDIIPDGMILEGRDLFWRRFMEGGWPMLQTDAQGNPILCGIYGTRFVEYLTVRRFDEFDRTPEVLAAHLLDAMQQLWTKPSS